MFLIQQTPQIAAALCFEDSVSDNVFRFDVYVRCHRARAIDLFQLRLLTHRSCELASVPIQVLFNTVYKLYCGFKIGSIYFVGLMLHLMGIKFVAIFHWQNDVSYSNVSTNFSFSIVIALCRNSVFPEYCNNVKTKLLRQISLQNGEGFLCSTHNLSSYIHNNCGPQRK